MRVTCDGGGNRYQSRIDLEDKRTDQALKTYFPRLNSVQAGVCSLQLAPNTSPWIVCPHRLLTFGKKGDEGKPSHQKHVFEKLIALAGFLPGDQVGIWPEVRVKYDVASDQTREQSLGEFDYRFDYVLMKVDRVKLADIQTARTEKVLREAGYNVVQVNSELLVEDYPVGSPIIVEVMTSSTSGGNKKKRTTIPMAFEDAVLGREHKAPTINRRQVWARMVSQLIVKSQVGIAWGGKTIWVLQDNLIDYIQTSTGLDVYSFRTDAPSEVNLLSFAYDDYNTTATVKAIPLQFHGLFSGPIKPRDGQVELASFQDIIQVGVIPPAYSLLDRLIDRKPGIITVT